MISGREKTGTAAYLDIETTGLSAGASEITVAGICVEDGAGRRTVQLVGEEISAGSLESAVAGAETVYTYNGSRFDLKFIREKTGLDMLALCRHVDLMHSCWRRNLFGGLKAVERKLGIPRKLEGVDGFHAVRLWFDYLSGDEDSLAVLLEYNREDVLNLITLREKLGM